MKARSAVLKITLILQLLTSWCVWAQDGLGGALSRVNLASGDRFGSLFAQPLAAADFDGDNKPDGAVLVSRSGIGPQGQFRIIELHFTGRSNAELSFESNETALALSALDVNKDGAADLVVEQRFTHKRLRVWLNDGRGDFHQVGNEDFPAPDAEGLAQLDSPSPGRGDLAVLLSQGTSEIGIPAAQATPYLDRSVPGNAVSLSSSIESRTIAANSSRAPPRI